MIASIDQEMPQSKKLNIGAAQINAIKSTRWKGFANCFVPVRIMFSRQQGISIAFDHTKSSFLNQRDKGPKGINLMINMRKSEASQNEDSSKFQIRPRSARIKSPFQSQKKRKKNTPQQSSCKDHLEGLGEGDEGFGFQKGPL